MAYSLGARFTPLPKYFTLLDPGSYHTDKIKVNKQNAAPFLSNAPRNTQTGTKLWTQAVYNQEKPHKIQNCTSMMSKQPRFPYEAFSAEDLEEILCKCGITSPCECPTENIKEDDVICQGKVRRHLIKGPTPRSILGDEGLSAPSRKDHGFNVLSDGSQQRIRQEIIVECPPFYDARVNRFTDFYRGWKWSQWVSKRTPKSLEVRPGPADYFFETEPNQEKECAEKVRAFKKKTSRQLRYIDWMQQKKILEGYPGPANYNPTLPRGTDLQFVGSKADRFPTKQYDVNPGPADHWIRRDFESANPPDIPCHAVLPEPACFGVKAKRFKTKFEEKPSPASYDVNLKSCNFVRCGTAPFGTSAKRFKQEINEESDEEEIIEKESEKEYDKNATKLCPTPTWEFKSKTVRMKPLVKKNNEPSPADFPQSKIKLDRSPESQYTAPFFSSQGRFQPWYNWIPVFGKYETPGPAKYCLEKPKCPPTFVRGPLYRATRFRPTKYQSPAPNKYKINDGIETILATHNQRLNNNIKAQHKFVWNEPADPKHLSIEEREIKLLNESISLLESDESTTNADKPSEEVKIVKPESSTGFVPPKSKMLRTFLYAHPLPTYV